MIEKKLVQVIEPVLDEIASLHKRVEEISKQTGPAGRDGVDGKDGANGQDGQSVDAIEVAKHIVENHLELIKQPEVSVEEVAATIVEKHLDKIKGEAGPKGDAGADAPPLEVNIDDVAVAIKSDAEFVESLKAPAVLAEEVAKHIVLDHHDELFPKIKIKQWQEGVYREDTVVEAEIGRLYKALRDTSSQPGKSADWERLGTCGFAWKGLRDKEASYENGDLYIDGGSTFIWWNGKGHMYAQRGKQGEQGIAGKDGRDGEDAPHIIMIKMDGAGSHIVLSNGTVFSADIDGLNDYIDARSTLKAQNAIEQYELEKTKIGIPFNVFRGVWLQSNAYKRGDVVNFGGALLMCAKDTSSRNIDADSWTKIASLSGGGGGGSATTPAGIVAFSTIVADVNLNAGNKQINNLANPTLATDAVNMQTMQAAIAAGSLFQSAINETPAVLGALPTPALNNNGHYWVWTGTAGYVVKATDPIIGTDLVGVTMQIGDWIQSDGSKWIHISGDLLSKSRWTAVGSFQTWVDKQYEVNSLVSYNGKYYRSSAAIPTGTTAPGVSPLWVDITPAGSAGVPVWDATTAYPVATFVQKAGIVYVSNAANTNQDPAAPAVVTGTYAGGNLLDMGVMECAESVTNYPTNLKLETTPFTSIAANGGEYFTITIDDNMAGGTPSGILPYTITAGDFQGQQLTTEVTYVLYTGDAALGVYGWVLVPGGLLGSAFSGTITYTVPGVSPWDKVSNQKLKDLHDVSTVIPPIDGDVLQYEGAVSMWKPAAQYPKIIAIKDLAQDNSGAAWTNVQGTWVRSHTINIQADAYIPVGHLFRVDMNYVILATANPVLKASSCLTQETVRARGVGTPGWRDAVQATGVTKIINGERMFIAECTANTIIGAAIDIFSNTTADCSNQVQGQIIITDLGFKDKISNI